jgi:hypothetical protein
MSVLVWHGGGDEDIFRHDAWKHDEGHVVWRRLLCCDRAHSTNLEVVENMAGKLNNGCIFGLVYHVRDHEHASLNLEIVKDIRECNPKHYNQY